MGFILIDLKKRDERSKLIKAVGMHLRRMDIWISMQRNDGTPPPADECAGKEQEYIDYLHKEFEKTIAPLRRVEAEKEEQRTKLVDGLEAKKGKLYARFSSTVDALRLQAMDMLKLCLDALEGFAVILPKSDAQIDAEFQNLVIEMEKEINESFPGGVKGLDAYDDELPDGIPSFDDWRDKLVEEKKASTKIENQASIEPAVTKIRANAANVMKAKINAAIQSTLEQMVTDLSGDVLPYLSEEDMASLRTDMVASVTEYAESRIDE